MTTVTEKSKALPTALLARAPRPSLHPHGRRPRPGWVALPRRRLRATDDAPAMRVTKTRQGEGKPLGPVAPYAAPNGLCGAQDAGAAARGAAPLTGMRPHSAWGPGLPRGLCGEGPRL